MLTILHILQQHIVEEVLLKYLKNPLYEIRGKA